MLNQDKDSALNIPVDSQGDYKFEEQYQLVSFTVNQRREINQRREMDRRGDRLSACIGSRWDYRKDIQEKEE